MNYKKHYDILCERGKQRSLDCYTEKHHIIPRCLGGTDEPENITELTPEEHYVAHQLLVKMFPDNKGLIWAALQMTGHENGKRNNNKVYGWLRRKIRDEAKQRTGKRNGSFNKCWFYNPKTLHNIKCHESEVPAGYIKGRYVKKQNKHYACKICERDTGSRSRKYCDLCKDHAKEASRKSANKNGLRMKEKFENDKYHRQKTLENLRKGRVKGIKRPRK